MSAGLPLQQRVWHPDETETLCPWCRAPMDAAQVPLDGLLRALCDGLVHKHPPGSGEADPDADERLMVDCPSCSRPSVLVLKEGSVAHRMDALGTLYPARTEKDRAYIEETRQRD